MLNSNCPVLNLWLLKGQAFSLHFLKEVKAMPFVKTCAKFHIFFFLFGLICTPLITHAGNIKVMKLGLGEGTITVSGTTPGINCGTVCDAIFTDGTSLTFSVTFDNTQYLFLGWGGDLSGTTTPTTVTLSGNVAVTANFELISPFPIITDFSPGTPTGTTGIKQYLADNPDVNTPARFLSALPDGFRQNWMLMTRSESLQTGTAEHPRLLLPSIDARFVFTIGLTPHGSYPGSHPLAVEYMQWDEVQKNFRFHEIVLGPIGDLGPFLPPSDPPTIPARSRMIRIDDSKCSKCHSTRNILNEGPSIGTNGILPGSVQVKNKPNWEAYDSWGGMMPFNRDRIYQGSVEDKAFRKLFNLWNWRGSDLNDDIRQVMEQLELQPPHVLAELPLSPHRITRNINNTTDITHINFGYDLLPALTTPPNNYPPIANNSTYGFGAAASTGPAFNQGGRYVTLRHTTPRVPPNNNDYNNPGSDEGRAVRFFDALGGFVSIDIDGVPGLDGNFNAQRIADEVVNHSYATGSVKIDVRPIFLAVAKGLITISGAAVTSTDEVARPLTIPNAFFDGRNGMTVNLLETDTDLRTRTIPSRKADIQKINLDRRIDEYLRYRNIPPARPGILAPADGLFQEYDGTAAPTITQVRQEAFIRPVETFPASTSINGGVFVDREDYSANTRFITLFRYFLEPLGVSVDKWSMGVRGRSRAYAFADVFNGGYLPAFRRLAIASITARPVRDRLTNAVITMDANPTDAQIMDAVNRTLAGLDLIDPIPKYTDVQRIFNKSCIECHGGLEYPPYSNYTNDRPGAVNLAEDESTGAERLRRPFDITMLITTVNISTSALYSRLIQTTEDCPYGLMPCGGPALTQTDIETIKRWIEARPTSRPYTVGDPHIKTVDGASYDFQAAGEYVLLRGDFFEIQTRQAAVTTAAPYGPNRHTGLTTCVSINTAVAMSVAGHRITYQPNLNGEPDPDGLQLRIDGELVQLGAAGIPFAPGSRIVSTSAPGGIQVNLAGGTAIIITPWFWSSYQIWGIGIDLRHPRASEGIMGAIAPDSWLPHLPDGSSVGPIPKSLGDRYKILYNQFAEAWRVTDSISLFDYAPGISAATFATDGWPRGESPQDCSLPSQKELAPIARADAEKLCQEVGDAERRELCILDVMATGEAGWAEPYISADIILRNTPPEIPMLKSPPNFSEGLTLPIDFVWDPGVDANGDPVKYKIYVWPVHETPDDNKATPLKTTDGGSIGSKMKCFLIVVLIGIVLWLLVYFLWSKNTPKLMRLLALLILLAAILAYFLCGKGVSPKGSITETVTDLQPDRDYFWRVIAEDGKGGTVVSETWRFELKQN